MYARPQKYGTVRKNSIITSLAEFLTMSVFFPLLDLSNDSSQQRDGRLADFLCHTQETSGGRKKKQNKNRHFIPAEGEKKLS